MQVLYVELLARGWLQVLGSFALLLLFVPGTYVCMLHVHVAQHAAWWVVSNCQVWTSFTRSAGKVAGILLALMSRQPLVS